MKKWIPISILAAIGVLSYAYYRKQVNLLKEFTYKIIGFNAKLQNNVVEVLMKIRVENKSNFEATIEKVYLDISLIGTPVGFVENTREIPIPAKSKVDVELRLVFDAQKVVKNIIGVLSNSFYTKSLQYSLNGYVKIKSYIFRVTLPVKESDIFRF